MKRVLTRYAKAWDEFLPWAMVILGVILAPIAGYYSCLPFKIGAATWIVITGILAVYCYGYLGPRGVKYEYKATSKATSYNALE